MKKIILTILIISSLIFNPLTSVHAQDSINCTTPGDGVPLITQIMCPLTRAVNVIVLFGGVVFSLMVISASYKYATSLGDPKAAMGAQATLTNAVLGFVVVVGFFLIFRVVTGFFGLTTFNSPISVFANMQCGIYKIFSCSAEDYRPIVSDLTPPGVWCKCD